MNFKGPAGQEDMPYLLTPGPLTTSRSVKQALLADWGSRDIEFRKLVKEIREELKRLAGCDDSYECVLMQGSGTFAIEAALGAFAPSKRKKTLVVANGAYGERAAQILTHIGRANEKVSKSDTTQLAPEHFTKLLDDDKSISHVWLIHCETTSGIVNPLSELARETKTRGRVFMVDAMSSFGALDINMARDGIDVMVSSSNKCVEGIPGFSYVLVKKELLLASEGQSHSIVLDLFQQWKGLEANGQFRFTPPTHALVAFRQALRELDEEGGTAARLRRYKRNADTLLKGMAQIGIQPLLSANAAGPIIQTFLTPADANFKFEDFYEKLRQRGFAIYPGKLTKRDSFRIGTIGALDEQVIERVVTAIKDVLAELNVKDMSPRDK
ncbi:2-aminoethylphosphonate--pyruvate transaminase [Aestuariivirga litoralis]|nr:2-aminoethylphosphonate--pyruvate transaminase [Aestuariivirga litoralis]